MRKPNIILIMTDQQRFDSISAYGNKEVSTPNMDKLAARGVIFDRAYAECPECVPARHAIICGQNALRTGVLSNAGSPLSPDTPTIMSVLRGNGYLTQAVGKMHFIPVREHFGFHNMKLSEEVPASVEDDEYHSFLADDGYLDYVNEPQGMRGQMYYVPQVSQLPKEKHATWWTASESIKFLDQMKGKDQPFFLFSSFIKPHPPFDPPTPYQYKYLPNDFTAPIKGEMDNVENWNHYQITQNLYKCNITDPYFLKTMKAFYHSCIAFVDDMIGKMLVSLEENGQLDNTIIVFCSDHGEFLGDHGCFGKRSWFEGPGRIPLFISYPGILPEGVRRNQLAGHHDIMPSLLSLAGINYDGLLDGIDLTDTMIKSNKTRDMLFGVLDWKEEGGGSLHSIITEEWKYTYCSVDGMEQLINIAADPEELIQRGMTSEDKNIRNKMEKTIFKHYQKLGVADEYFTARGEWKKLHLKREKKIKELYVNPDNQDNIGRYFCASEWNGLNCELRKRIASPISMFGEKN